MQFNSYQFLIFFTITYGLYLALPHKGQNILLLIASYFFYGWWDWRFLVLLAISSTVDFVAGVWMERETEPAKRRWPLILSLCSNLGILGFFKYYNFFASEM